MAVFTPLNERQIRDMLSAYDLGGYIGHEDILEGVENSNFYVFTDRAHIILTVFEYRTNISDLPFFFGYTDHLVRKGISCPGPILNRNGGPTAMVAGKYGALFPFLEGESLSVGGINPAHCREVGAFVARMHRAAADFRMTRENALSLEGWKNLAAKTRERADAVQSGLSRSIDDELSWLESNWPSALPRGAVHTDIFPDNVFFKDDKVSGIIDFYFSATDMLAYDLAIAINAWCFDENFLFRADRYRELWQGYESIRPLSAEEKSAMPVLLRGASLRFLMTRLHDWIFHDPESFVKPHDPLAYVSRLRFHQKEALVA